MVRWLEEASFWSVWEQENAEDVKRNRRGGRAVLFGGGGERFGFGCVRLNEMLAG